MLHKIRIIAFDLDDTLWPCMPVIEQAEETLYIWLDRHFPRITQRYSREDMVSRRKQFMRDNPHYSVNMTQMRQEFLRFLALESNYDSDSLVEQGFEVFFQARQKVTFYEDVLPSLQKLSRHYRLGSISNGNASVEHVGLGHIFEHSVSAADINVAKPDRRIFHKLADHFDESPANILYVGDHPEYDVVAPEQAGMPSVWVNRENVDWPSEFPAPRYQVSNLQQLVEILLRSR